MRDPDRPAPSPTHAADSAARLQHALDALESGIGDGMHGLAGRIEGALETVAAVSAGDVAASREEIRALTGELLELNARIQKLARLKRLLG
jgi:hypothetical protein